MATKQDEIKQYDAEKDAYAAGVQHASSFDSNDHLEALRRTYGARFQ
jgi:hypothetical protein